MLSYALEWLLAARARSAEEHLAAVARRRLNGPSTLELAQCQKDEQTGTTGNSMVYLIVVARRGSSADGAHSGAHANDVARAARLE